MLLFASAARADFTATSSTLPTGSAPFSVAIADLNGDGRRDLASANTGDNSVTTQLKDATGGGYTPTSVSVGGAPVSVAVGDLNGDGRRDIATADVGTDQVTVLLKNSGDDDYTPTTVDLDPGSGPVSVAIGDLDGDGHADLAVATSASDSVTILHNDGSGDSYTVTTISLPSGSAPNSVAIGDLNGDGRPDIATANATDNSVSVLLKDASGSGYTQSNAGSAGGFPVSVAIGDLDGDGKADLAVANSQGNSVTVLLQDASGGTYTMSTAGVTGARPQSIAIGDLNGDGKLDLATANATGNSVSVFLKDASGSGYTVTTLSTGAGSIPQSIAIGDLNGDGKLDLATANSNADSMTLFTSTTPQASKVTLTASPASSLFGQLVTFTATVGRQSTPAGGAPTPTGTVTYTVDGRQLSPITLSGSGTATLPTSALGVGSHTVKADYSGDGYYTPSSATITYIVGATTTITGNRSGSLVVTGRTYIVNAHITGSVSVQSGASLDMENSTVGGSFASSSAAALRVCGSTIGGSMAVSNSTGLVVVGDVAGIQCAVNSITGSFAVQNNTHGARVIGNHVGGSFAASGNSGQGPYPGDPTLITGNGH